MGKSNMDKDTILFIDSKNNRALGMNYNFYSKRYNEITPEHKILDPDYILYKTGDSLDSWINFQGAVNSRTGSMESRIAEAKCEMLYRITDLTIIPQTIYYDEEGFIWNISPYDGGSESTYWISRSDDMDLRQGYDFEIDESGKHVYIKFNKYLDVDNALISINGIFYDYIVKERGDKPIIFVPDLVGKLSINKINTSRLSSDEIEKKLESLSIEIQDLQSKLACVLSSNLKFNSELEKIVSKLIEVNFIDEELKKEAQSLKDKISLNDNIIEDYNRKIQEKTEEYNEFYSQSIRFVYNVVVKAYTWENVKKDKLTSPSNIADEWFETISNVDDNCIIIYKGVIMDHEVNPINPRQFRFKDVELPAMKLMRESLHKIRIYRFSHMDSNKGIRKYIVKGHNNIHRNTVDFVLPVHQSLIVYEGVDHQYDVVEAGTIVYSTDVNYVDDSASVLSINFTPAG